MKRFQIDSTQPFDHNIIIRLFPLAVAMLVVYTPFSFFVSHEYVAGWFELFSLLILIVFRWQYHRLKDLNLFKDTLIFLGFPVLLPWLISGGPAEHGLWWSPIYVLWVSFFAKGKRYFAWLILFVLTTTAFVFVAKFGYLKIAYSISELLHLLFAFCISAALIYYYELWRIHYKSQSDHEMMMRLQEQDKYKQLLDSAPDAIIVANLKGEIILANRQAEKMFGFGPDELMQKSAMSLLSKRNKQHGIKYLLRCLSQKNGRSVSTGQQLLARHRDGFDFPIELSMNVDHKTGVVTTTIRNMMEKFLRTTQLIKQNSQLNDLAHIAAQNIRGPVKQIRQQLILVQEDSVPKEIKKESFMQMNNLLNNLDKTMNELLDVVTFRSYVDELKEVSFEEVMQQLLLTYKAELRNTEAAVTFDFSKVSKLTYSIVYLESIMQNLLTNAIRFRAVNRKLHVHFESDSQNGQTILRVTDNGLGIDMERYGEKLFGLKETFHDHPDGKGVGLFMIRSQIESLGGEITAESTENVGTKFTVIFNKNVAYYG